MRWSRDQNSCDLQRKTEFTIEFKRYMDSNKVREIITKKCEKTAYSVSLLLQMEGRRVLGRPKRQWRDQEILEIFTNTS
jgi:hypothetical protein